MKRWRYREKQGDLIESPRGEFVLYDDHAKMLSRALQNLDLLRASLKPVQGIGWVHQHDFQVDGDRLLCPCGAITAVPQSAPIDTVSGNGYSAVHGKDESGTAPGTAREAREDGPEAV